MKRLVLFLLLLPCCAFSANKVVTNMKRVVPPAPTQVQFSEPATTTVKVSWEEPGSGLPITSYVLERKAGPDGTFTAVYSGTDLFHISTGLEQGLEYFFRVKAINADGESDFSPEASYMIGQMLNGTLTTCNVAFMDPGGAGSYSNDTDVTMTFIPVTPGEKIMVSFDFYNTENLFDFLYIHDGPDTSGELIASLTNEITPGNFFATTETGELTFRFVSDQSVTNPGWSGLISCYTPGNSAPDKPGPVTLSPKANNTVTLNWEAPFDYESEIVEYTLERKAGTDGEYAAVYVGAALEYDDTCLENGITYYYRVLATNGVGNSEYSSETLYIYGQMLAGTVTGCDMPFLDTGGTGPYTDNQITVMTFAPENPEDKLKVSFSSFAMQETFDYLQIYEGPNTDREISVTLTGSELPEDLVSKATGGELTFRFRADWAQNNAGWEAFITCEALGTIPPDKPGPVTFTYLTPTSVNVEWREPEDFDGAITAYTLEQKTGEEGVWEEVFTGNALLFEATGLAEGIDYVYRVKATNINGDSPFSVERSYRFGQIANGSVTTCNFSLTDPGGTGNYLSDFYSSMTFRPENAGDKVMVSFSSFAVEYYWDNLRVYNGASIASPILATLTGTDLPENIISSSEDGALTLEFQTDKTGTLAGWEAMLTCVNVPGQPAMVTFGDLTDDSAVVNWLAPASNGAAISGYRLEQKQGAEGTYEEVYTGEGLTYTASGLTAGTTYFFRLKAENGVGSSAYSEETSVCIPFKWFKDEDGDGLGDPAVSLYSCADQEGYVKNADDCNDADAGTGGGPVWYADTDGDGYGNETDTKTSCTKPDGYVDNKTDCDDSNATINPDKLWYPDADGDGYGNAASSTKSCTKPEGHVDNKADCDDSSAAVNPDQLWYADTDGDGYGDAASGKSSCTKPDGYADNSTDCNDSNATVYSNAPELWDGLDNNCDGTNDNPTQTITFAALEEKVFADGGLTYALSASANTGLAVEFTVEGTSASISGNELTVSAPGSYTVTARQAGGSYFSAVQTSQTICVFPPQAILTDGSAATPPVITLGNPFSGTVHHWYLNDELLLESSEAILPLTQSGTYKVKIVAGGCEGGFSEALEIDLGSVTGLEAIGLGLLRIYPNPSERVMTIEAASELQSIGMYGLDGKEVYKAAISGSSSHVIDLEALLPGTYILITQLSDGRKNYSRIIRK